MRDGQPKTPPRDTAGEGRLIHAPAGHPPVARPKIGILIANLGTPDATDYWTIRRYLSEFLSDKRVIDYPWWKWQPILQLFILSKRPFSKGKDYELIWNKERNESPLMTITRDQAFKIAGRMKAALGEGVMVDFCMRYGNPSTESKVREMVAAGCEKILFFPLYPQYAGATSATANDQFFRALMKEKWQPAARTVAPYYDQPAYVEALAASVRRA
ncbi:MAG TPA: ferrochelatase, partial [Paracoccus sp.]|nr:ferrochelatase [Paracoccus sp. (in: a-proteobacteria)]